MKFLLLGLALGLLTSCGDNSTEIPDPKNTTSNSDSIKNSDTSHSEDSDIVAEKDVLKLSKEEETIITNSVDHVYENLRNNKVYYTSTSEHFYTSDSLCDYSRYTYRRIQISEDTMYVIDVSEYRSPDGGILNKYNPNCSNIVFDESTYIKSGPFSKELLADDMLKNYKISKEILSKGNYFLTDNEFDISSDYKALFEFKHKHLILQEMTLFYLSTDLTGFWIQQYDSISNDIPRRRIFAYDLHGTYSNSQRRFQNIAFKGETKAGSDNKYIPLFNIE